MAGQDVVLSVQDLSIDYLTRRGRLQAVSHVSFDLHRGETLALIGESGCGKSTLNFGLMRLLPKTARTEAGKIVYTDRQNRSINILELNPRALRRFRWSECAMVFQGAQNSLNPVIHVRDMIFDTARAHGMNNRNEVRQRALELFRKVRLDPDRVFNAYPHELSGGMRQRVLIALGLLLNPQVVIFDEPTTALDILTQRSILNVLRDLKEELGFSSIFISHDLAVAAEIADTVATMYAGEIVEMGPVNDIFYEPRHAYTLGLMEASPRLSVGREELEGIPGSPPDLVEPPTGCKFHIRCPLAIESCKTTPPQLERVGAGHIVACYKSNEVLEKGKALRALPATHLS
ncbi:MAG: ABC transporter ATP-binding protein [Chloroflexi bacterium]|nr:ABC transporter ATP-binding protein [Chloroflexota bacterium]